MSYDERNVHFNLKQKTKKKEKKMGGQLAPKGAQIRIAGALSLFVLASLYIYTHPA